MGDMPRVEFALGSEVSLEHFFKSSFARSFVTNCRDSKSLDYELLDYPIAEETETTNNNNNNNESTTNNNFYSLVNFGAKVTTKLADNNTFNKDNVNLWKTSKAIQSTTDNNELDSLRKQCQSLIEENRRLQNALTIDHQIPQVQMIDSVYLQTQVETLQWQLKQVEANRQMYRSLMEQVVRFLDRARKSLDILREKSNLEKKNSTGRVPRSRSVHAVHADCSPNRGGRSVSSTSSTSHFTRAKSVTQISPCATGYREFTWSMLRRNEPAHSTPPRNECPDLNKTHEGIIYRRPKQAELDPNDVPPEKLSQEAFRLMRTVQSLLSMREPELARLSPVDNTDFSSSPVDHRHRDSRRNDVPLTTQNNSFIGPNLQEVEDDPRRSRNGRGNDSGSTDNDGRSCYLKSSSNVAEGDHRTLRTLFSGVRTSIDATSLNSGSSKTTEEEDTSPINRNPFNVSLTENERRMFSCTPSSTPNRRVRKVEKKDKSSKSKQTGSASSAEDESGFSSMSSFQEIGLPNAPPISPIRGYHTEIGLPEVPMEKGKHRRWSSTPAEIQALFKRRSSFATSQTAAESLSVWV